MMSVVKKLSLSFTWYVQKNVSRCCYLKLERTYQEGETIDVVITAPIHNKLLLLSQIAVFCFVKVW